MAAETKQHFSFTSFTTNVSSIIFHWLRASEMGCEEVGGEEWETEMKSPLSNNPSSVVLQHPPYTVTTVESNPQPSNCSTHELSIHKWQHKRVRIARIHHHARSWVRHVQLVVGKNIRRCFDQKFNCFTTQRNYQITALALRIRILQI